MNILHRACISGLHSVSMGPCGSGWAFRAGFVTKQGMGLGLEGWIIWTQKESALGGKSFGANRKAEFLQQTLRESRGAVGTNLERRVWLKLGRTGQTTELGTYEVSELSRLPCLHGFPRRTSSRNTGSRSSQGGMALQAWSWTQYCWHYLWGYQAWKPGAHWVRNSGMGPEWYF